ncbi:MAG: hypothetical protein ACT4NT_06630 [Nitrososphaerota archaeon]
MTDSLKYDPFILSDHRKHTGDYYFTVKIIFMNSDCNSFLLAKASKEIF